MAVPEQTIPRVAGAQYVHGVHACIVGYGNMETSSPFEYAAPFAESILIGNLAIRSSVLETAKGERKEDNFTLPKLKWDAKEMKVTNYDEANQFVRRKYRDGYSLNI